MFGFSELLIKMLYLALCISYMFSAIYTYARLNYELNTAPKIDERRIWNRNRNIAILLSLGIPYIMAIYLYLENEGCGVFSLRDKSFKIYVPKRDPLVEQVIDAPLPNKWEGKNSLSTEMKKLWESV